MIAFNFLSQSCHDPPNPTHLKSRKVKQRLHSNHIHSHKKTIDSSYIPKYRFLHKYIFILCSLCKKLYTSVHNIIKNKLKILYILSLCEFVAAEYDIHDGNALLDFQTDKIHVMSTPGIFRISFLNVFGPFCSEQLKRSNALVWTQPRSFICFITINKSTFHSLFYLHV